MSIHHLRMCANYVRYRLADFIRHSIFGGSQRLGQKESCCRHVVIYEKPTRFTTLCGRRQNNSSRSKNPYPNANSKDDALNAHSFIHSCKRCSVTDECGERQRQLCERSLCIFGNKNEYCFLMDKSVIENEKQ